MSPEPLDLAVLDRHPDGVLRLLAVRAADGTLRDFACTYANAAAASLLARPDLAGKTLSQGLPAFERGHLLGAFAEAVRSGEPCRREIELLSAGPALEITALKDGDGLLVFLARRRSERASADIAERQRAGQDREERLALLDGLVAHAPIGIALFDRDLRFLTLNDEAATVDGIPKAGHIGKTVGEIVPGVSASVEPLLRRVRDTGQAVRNVEISGQTPAAPSQERHWIASYYPIRDAGGEIIGVGAAAKEITERKLAEAKLRESEERFQQFMRNCPTGAYIKDADGRYLWVNAFVERLFDRPLRDWVGKTDEDLFPSDEAARVRANDRAVLDAQARTTFVETFPSSEGRETWLSYKFPIQDPRGGRPLLAGMSVNITEQVRASEEVRRLNTELANRAGDLQTLLDLVPVAIFMAHDPECLRITGNRAAAELLAAEVRSNLSLTAVPGERPPPHKLIHQGRELAPSELPIQQAARGAEIRGEEYEIVFEDGARKHIFGYASPLLDAERKVRGSVAAFVDVTEPFRTRRRLETMFSTSLIGSMTWRLGGTVTRANDAFLEMMGYSRDDLATGRLTCAALAAPGCGPADDAARAELMANRRHAPFEKEYLRKDGARVPVLVSSALFPDSDDEGISYVVDLSEVKRAEQQIRDLLVQVTAASRAKDEFLATLAHELRNPLASIRNAVQILKSKGPDDPKLAWSLGVIDRQVRHMARLLEDLLDVSRISRNKLELRRERVELSSVIEAAIETSRPLIDAARHELIVSAPRGSVYVDGDPVRLAQIFSNLLNNAAKYTPEGGKVALTVERRDSMVAVTVRDNGIGIARDMLPRVFDIFAQAAPALDMAQGGLGIGLSLVRGLVQLHGGAVSARSEGSDRGSEFVVELPVVDPPAREEPREDAAPARALRHRVLVVDDNADSADSLAALLEILGSEVMTAYGGAEALAAAETFEPTAVLLDIGMPGMNGFEVCQRLRAQPWGRRALLIAMTGWGQEEDRRQTREAGFDHHMVKPVDASALTQLLEERGPQAGM
jgi:PAS domain S-box-containing protein